VRWRHDELGRRRSHQQPNFGPRLPVERNAHRVAAGLVERKVDGCDEGEVKVGGGCRNAFDVELTVGRPEFGPARIDPSQRHGVASYIAAPPFESHDKVSAWMDGRERFHVYGVEHAEDVQLPFLRDISRVGEERKGDVHPETYGRRLPFGMAVSVSPIVAPGDARPNDTESRLATDLLLLLMATIWGINFSVLKYGTRFVSPLAFNGVRIPIAAASQLAIARAMRLQPAPRRIVWRLLALGMLGNGVYQVLFILGVVRSRVATAALIIAATPAFVAIIGRLFGTETLKRRQWLGIVLQIAGCSTVVIGSARGAAGQDSPLGALLLLGAALSWAAYSVMLRRLAADMHVLQLGGYTMLGGALLVGAVGAHAVLATPWTTFPVGVFAALFYSAMMAMVLAYLLWYRGLRVLGPTRTAVYSNLQPIIAALVAYIAFREIPTLTQGVGAVGVISGLLLTRR